MPAWLYEYGRALGSFVLLSAAAALLGVALIPAYLFVAYVYQRFGVFPAVVSLPFAYAVWGTGYAVIVVVLKHVTWSRFRPGTYSFASWTVVRWATIGYLVEVCHWIFMRFVIGTPFLNLWYRALGAKIGRRVTINTVVISDWDMLTIDDDVFVGGHAAVIGHAGESNALIMAPVHLGKRCTIGHQGTVFPGVVMEDGAILGAHSIAPKFTRLTKDSVWGGVPARFVKHRKSLTAEEAQQVLEGAAASPSKVTDA